MTTDRDENLVEIRLLRFPLRVYARATEHYEELFREFALLAASSDHDADAVPIRLLSLIDMLGRRYPPQAQLEEERAAALARGDLERDFSMTVPRSAGEASEQLGDLLDEADEFCRAGDLLTLAAPAEAVAFRCWYLGEVVAQAKGAQPSPWPGDLD
jgi:hypothetical protein